MLNFGRDTSVVRYVAVSQVLAREMGGMTLSEALQDVVRAPVRDLDGRLIRVSERTLRRWVDAFKRNGFDGLCPKKRDSVCRALSADMLRFLVTEKEADPDASLPEIARRAKVDGIATKPISPASLWRAARRLNLPIFAEKGDSVSDKRRFAFAHRMQMGLVDGKHFRAGVRRRKRVVITFLDDASRFGLRAVVGSSEHTGLFLRGLWQCICKWGKFRAMYADRGSAFKSSDAVIIAARLEIALIHGTPDYPEGHGKIERYNQTMLQDLLRTFDGNPEIDPDEAALELRINHYLENIYNRRIHESLEGKTPEERFLLDALPLRRDNDLDALKRHFVIRHVRKAAKDNVVQIGGVFFETPTGHAGRRIEIFRHTLDGIVSMIHEGRLMELKPVDPTLNAHLARARKAKKERSNPRPIRSAATRLFNQDFMPITTNNGDFPEKE